MGRGIKGEGEIQKQKLAQFSPRPLILSRWERKCKLENNTTNAKTTVETYSFINCQSENSPKKYDPAEKKFWSLVRANRLGVHFRRQVPFGPYILDFFCMQAKLVVELDGSQHLKKEAQEYDHHRDEYVRANGFTVIRFMNKEFLTNTDGVMRYIWEFVNKDAKT